MKEQKDLEIDKLDFAINKAIAFLTNAAFEHEEQRDIAMAMCSDILSRLAEMRRYLNDEVEINQVAKMDSLRQENKLLRALTRQLLTTSEEG